MQEPTSNPTPQPPYIADGFVPVVVNLDTGSGLSDQLSDQTGVQTGAAASAQAGDDTRVNPDSAHRRFDRRSRAARLRGAWRMFRTTLALLSLLAGGFIIYTWLGMSAAVRIVEKQAAAIRDGRIDEAYGLFSESYRAENSLGMFRAWVDRHEEFSRAQDMRIWSRSMRSERAVLWGVVQDFRGQGYPVRYRMIREGGEWRIDELTMRRSWAQETMDDLPREAFI